MKLLLLAAALAAGALAFQDAQDPSEMHAAKPGEQHAWLQQLVGEWTCKTEASMGPDVPPMTFESEESVRSVGGLWIVGEQTSELNGESFTSIITLGYDERKQAYVGTWIDTVQTHMWSYLGHFDDGKKTLTLETEGPSFEDPSKSCKFRDAIELRDPDHKVLTSSTQAADGSWTTFMSAEYTRKKK